MLYLKHFVDVHLKITNFKQQPRPPVAKELNHVPHQTISKMM